MIVSKIQIAMNEGGVPPYGMRRDSAAAFKSVVSFLREYSVFMDDQAGVQSLLSALEDWRGGKSPVIRESWVASAAAARNQGITPTRKSTTLDAREALDAMIQFLERLRPSFASANSYLVELYYDEISPSGAPNTADPATWYDWLRHFNRDSS